MRKLKTFTLSMVKRYPLLLFLLTTGYGAFSQAEANYDEAKVRQYVLPNALSMPDGRLAKSVADWEKVVRPKTVSLVAQTIYGVTPSQSISLRFDQVNVKIEARNGKAIRKRINIIFNDYPLLPPIEVLLYIPKAATKPVPVFVCLNFVGNQGVTDETDLPVSDRWMMNSFA